MKSIELGRVNAPCVLLLFTIIILNLQWVIASLCSLWQPTTGEFTGNLLTNLLMEGEVHKNTFGFSGVNSVAAKSKTIEVNGVHFFNRKKNTV